MEARGGRGRCPRLAAPGCGHIAHPPAHVPLLPCEHRRLPVRADAGRDQADRGQ